ncbi:MAG TPA: hypothetical protein VFX12_09815 [Vicinamibacterales bacterium]|nr:hypothetical protein [Vicinamibacterales bacterium]
MHLATPAMATAQPHRRPVFLAAGGGWTHASACCSGHDAADVMLGAGVSLGPRLEIMAVGDLQVGPRTTSTARWELYEPRQHATGVASTRTAVVSGLLAWSSCLHGPARLFVSAGAAVTFQSERFETTLQDVDAAGAVVGVSEASSARMIAGPKLVFGAGVRIRMTRILSIVPELRVFWIGPFAENGAPTTLLGVRLRWSS